MVPSFSGPIFASRKNSSVVSVRSTAWRRLTQPFSTPIGYAVSANPIEAIDANGRDGKRSGVIPLTSLVVSQKNWNVRFSMSLNSGGNAGLAVDSDSGAEGGGSATGSAGGASSSAGFCGCSTAGRFPGSSIFLHATGSSTRHGMRRMARMDRPYRIFSEIPLILFSHQWKPGRPAAARIGHQSSPNDSLNVRVGMRILSPLRCAKFGLRGSPAAPRQPS